MGRTQPFAISMIDDALDKFCFRCYTFLSKFTEAVADLLSKTSDGSLGMQIGQGATPMPENLQGVWKLIKIGDQATSGEFEMRDHEVRGKLIYTAEGCVFVALAYLKPSGYESNFYTGTFTVELDQAKIFHTVEIASDSKRIGKTLERDFRLENDSLILRGLNPTNKVVELIWQRMRNGTES